MLWGRGCRWTKSLDSVLTSPALSIWVLLALGTFTAICVSLGLARVQWPSLTESTSSQLLRDAAWQGGPVLCPALRPCGSPLASPRGSALPAAAGLVQGTSESLTPAMASLFLPPTLGSALMANRAHACPLIRRTLQAVSPVIWWLIF